VGHGRTFPPEYLALIMCATLIRWRKDKRARGATPAPMSEYDMGYLFCVMHSKLCVMRYGFMRYLLCVMRWALCVMCHYAFMHNLLCVMVMCYVWLCVIFMCYAFLCVLCVVMRLLCVYYAVMRNTKIFPLCVPFLCVVMRLCTSRRRSQVKS
jgi:hypothetical protein